MAYLFWSVHLNLSLKSQYIIEIVIEIQKELIRKIKKEKKKRKLSMGRFPRRSAQPRPFFLA
jgi:hypothetical protein